MDGLPKDAEASPEFGQRAPAAPEPTTTVRTGARPSLRDRTIALVGMMGVGKTTIGRRLATAIRLPFRDADQEIETAAGCTVADFFAERGEAEFRQGERRVIARLLDQEPHVLATGGGAFMDEGTRALIAEKAISVWLKAPLDLMVERVRRKPTRPLVKDKDPREVLEALIESRYPVYAQAEITVEVGGGPHEAAVDAIISALNARGGR